jgi:hypothetical protein
MNVVEIPLTAQPQTFSIALNDVFYNWRLYWLVPAQCWVVDIADIDGNKLVCGIPLVTGADLLRQFGYVMAGRMFVISDQMPPDIVPDFIHLGVTGHLYYQSPGQTEQDLLEQGG